MDENYLLLMARLIIGHDIIQFYDEGTQFNGEIARLVIDDETIYIIKYHQDDVNEQEIRKIKRNFCAELRQYAWVNYPGNEEDDFSRAMGRAIEKCPHLMAS